MINKQRSLIAGLQIRYDYRDWWFHLTCINMSRKGKKSYTIEEEACTKFLGPVALTNVLMDIDLQASHHKVSMKLHTQDTWLVDLHHVIGTVTKEITLT